MPGPPAAIALLADRDRKARREHEAERDGWIQRHGRGFFADVTATALPSVATLTVAVEAADVDGDGDVDLVANSGVYRNDGSGTFQLDGLVPGTSGGAGWHYDLAVGDIDRDGDLDALVATGTSVGLVEELESDYYENDGTGVFSRTTLVGCPYDSRGAAIGDIDEDGDVDVVIANTLRVISTRTCIYRNDGTTPLPLLLPRLSIGTNAPDRDQTMGMALADFDGDRDLDLLLSNSNPINPGDGESRLLVNLRRHLHAPYVASLGKDYHLDVYGDPGELALLMLSPGFARISWAPYGTLGLDPRFLLFLGTQVVPSSRVVTWQLPLAGTPELLGLPIYSQALLADMPRTAATHLTNVEVDVVVNH
ncbi:MAG: VCBS repeat-containing protein [Planctomycetota bacterium]